MKKTIFYVIILLVSLSACHKDKKELVPEAQIIEVKNGSIRGKVSPAGSIFKAYLSGYINFEIFRYETTPDNSGNFSVADVVPGDYVIEFRANPGYTVPNNAPIQLSVTAGKNTDLGNYVFKKYDYGSISGKIIPAGSVTQVQADLQDTGPLIFTGIIDPNTGYFKIDYAKAGTYSLVFSPAEQYEYATTPPANYKIIVNNNKDNDAGSFHFTRYGYSSLSLLVDGTEQKLKGTARYNDNKFGLQASISNGRPLEGGYFSNTLTINLDNLTQVGTYECNSTTTSDLVYRISKSPFVTGGGTWSSSNAGSNATVVITTIDPVANIISGTFNATSLYAKNGTSKVITSGTFQTSYK